MLSRTDASGATTSYGYFPQGSTGAGRVAAVTRADLTVARSAYDLRGNKTREWGSAAAPTAYGFDGYNQLETLATVSVVRSTVRGHLLRHLHRCHGIQIYDTYE